MHNVSILPKVLSLVRSKRDALSKNENCRSASLNENSLLQIELPPKKDNRVKSTITIPLIRPGNKDRAKLSNNIRSCDSD